MTTRAGAPVVVGVDGSARALSFAAEEASLRATELFAVHAWMIPAVVGPPAMMPPAHDPPAMAQEEWRLLAGALSVSARSTRI